MGTKIMSHACERKLIFEQASLAGAGHEQREGCAAELLQMELNSCDFFQVKAAIREFEKIPYGC